MTKAPFKTRYFNLIKDNKDGSVNKSSKIFSQKIIDEIDWYLRIPEDLKPFSAKMISYNKKVTLPNYSLMYYKLPTLAEYFISSQLTLDEWEAVIDLLFETLTCFNKHQKSVSKVNFWEVYYEKTMQRLAEIENLAYWKNLFTQEFITINGKPYKNVLTLMRIIKTKYRNFITEDDSSVIHGDLCMSNILFDKKKNHFIFIDPKGSWGTQGIYGDIKYDVAKLRHSFGSFYDFIIRDLFALDQSSENSFTFHTKAQSFHEEVKKLFDKKLEASKYSKNLVKVIESLLFLSMLPLHKESFMQQRAMFLTGIILLNENIKHL